MTSNVLDAPLPERWGRAQRLKNTLLYYTIRLAVSIAKRVPFFLAWTFAAVLGHLAAICVGGERRRSLLHLEQALPELTRSEHRRIVRQMFVHLARSAVELLHTQRFLQGKRAVSLSNQQRQLLEEALAEGRGVVAITGHIGNWELLAQVLATAGFPISSVAKPLYDPRLTRFVHRERTAHGMQILWRGDNTVSKDILRVFKTNRILALLIDQDTKVPGIFVPFFGRPAHTPSAPASLALRFKAPVLMAWMHRQGRQHEVHLERVSVEEHWGVEELTEHMNTRLETAIRQHPEQWVWMHRRWHTAQ